MARRRRQSIRGVILEALIMLVAIVAFFIWIDAGGPQEMGRQIGNVMASTFIRPSPMPSPSPRPT